MRNHRLLLILLVSIFLGGCTSGSSTAGPAPAPTTTNDGPTADVLVMHVLNRAITAPISSLRFTARDGQNHVLFSTSLMPVQDQIRLTPVPVQATELLIEYLDAQGLLLGVYLAPLQLVEGQTYVVNDPGFLDVQEAVVALDVTPLNPSLARGTFLPLTATATLNDGTSLDVSSQVQWTSQDPATATVSSTGLVSGLNPGSTAITADLGMIASQVPLDVTAATLTRLVVAPPTGNVAAGTSQQFVALGVFSDGTTQDLSNFSTWAATGAATVDNLGLATGTVAGNAQVTASFGGQTGQGDLTVKAANLVSIDVQPNNLQLSPGANQAFTATGTFSDGTTQNLTGSAVWTSTGSVAGNVFTAGATGNFTVTATQGSVSQTVSLLVTQPTGAGPLVFTGHDASMFRILGFSQNPLTGELTPLATGYPQDSTFFPGTVGSLVHLFANPVSRTALVLNRYTTNNAGSQLRVSDDGTSVNAGLYFTVGASAVVADWGPDGRTLVQPSQTSLVALTSYGPDGTFIGSSPAVGLGATITAMAMTTSGRFVHASTSANIYTLPINNPNTLGAAVATAQTGVTFLEAGPQARALYAITNNDTVNFFTLNLTTGAPTLSSSTSLPGARELLLSPDQRWLFALTNGPDEVWVYPVDQTNLSLGTAVGPFPAGMTPTGLTTDRAGTFLYLASSGDNTVVAYAINKISGQLTAVTGSPFATGQNGLSDVMFLP